MKKIKVLDYGKFGKQVYEELLALAVDDEIGDYTDIVNGRDLTVETVGPESTGTPYNKIISTC